MGLKELGIKTGSWLLNVGPRSDNRRSKTLATDKLTNDHNETSNPGGNPFPSNELAGCESTPNLHLWEASNDPFSQHSRQQPTSSSPKSLLRMFSVNKQKKKDHSNASASSHNLRITIDNSTPKASAPRRRSNTLQQSSDLNRISAAPSKSTKILSTSDAPSPARSSPEQRLDEEERVSSTQSFESVTPFTTAAPASAASFTITPASSHPTCSCCLGLGALASLYSEPASSITKLATPAPSQRGSVNFSHRPTKSDCTLKDFTRSEAAKHSPGLPYPIPVSRALPAKTSGNKSGTCALNKQLTETCQAANPLTVQGDTSNKGLVAFRKRETLGNRDCTGTDCSEIARLTRQLTELSEDRDQQVAKLSALRAELTQTEASLHSEQISGRQELEAFLELQAQHQTLQRTLREREADRQALLDEKADLEKRLEDTLTLLHEANSNNQDDLVMERNQLRGWLDEEKARHNEVRAELAQARTNLRTSNARIAHLEAISQEQGETIHVLQKRDTDANESALREINYYQEQLNEALRSRDELRNELDRTKEQVRVLRNSMEQLLKAGVAEDRSDLSFPLHPTHPKARPAVDTGFPNFSKDPNMSAKHHSRSHGSDELESITSSDFLGMASGDGSIRNDLSNLKGTIGADATVEPSLCDSQEDLVSSSIGTASVFSPNSLKIAQTQTPAEVETEGPRYWDQRLKELLKQKDQINLEYSRIPTSKLTLTVRRRKESLERALDQLDADISGARSKIRALVI